MDGTRSEKWHFNSLGLFVLLLSNCEYVGSSLNTELFNCDLMRPKLWLLLSAVWEYLKPQRSKLFGSCMLTFCLPIQNSSPQWLLEPPCFQDQMPQSSEQLIHGNTVFSSGNRMWLSVPDHLLLSLASLGGFYGDRIPLCIFYKIYAFVVIKAFHGHFSYLKNPFFNFPKLLENILISLTLLFLYNYRSKLDIVFLLLKVT